MEQATHLAIVGKSRNFMTGLQHWPLQWVWAVSCIQCLSLIDIGSSLSGKEGRCQGRAKRWYAVTTAGLHCKRFLRLS